MNSTVVLQPRVHSSRVRWPTAGVFFITNWIALLAICASGGCAGTVQSVRFFESRKCPSVLGKFHRGRLVNKVDLVEEWKKAETAVAAGDYEGAISHLEKLAKLMPQDPEVRLFLADTLLLADKPTEALDLLLQLEREAPLDPRVHHLLGLTWDQLGDGGRAFIHHQQALLLQPDDPVYLACYEAIVASSPR